MNVELMDYWHEKITNNHDPMVIVITTHILTEFIINKIIEQKYRNSQKNVFAGNRSYSYAIKLTIVDCIEEFNEYYYKNLVLLNKLRNNFAHQYIFLPEKFDLRFFQAPPKYDRSGHYKWQEVTCKNKNDPDEVEKFLKSMCCTILLDLIDYAKRRDIDLS